MTSTSSPAGDHPGEGDQKSEPAALTASFLMALAQEVVDDANLTPAALSRAIGRVLPVDGAGLSTMASGLRMPLGSSSDAAARAEVLQTSLGEGPCLEAAEAQAPMAADLAELTTRWPTYTEELTGKTPFRAVAAIPLYAPGRGVFAALDLYATDPRLSDRLDLAEVEERVAAPAAALLTTCVEQLRDIENQAATPEWYQSASGRRHDVWVAVGMVMAVRPGRTRDALSLLRAHAYTQGRSLDDLAADVVDGRLPPTDLTD